MKYFRIPLKQGCPGLLFLLSLCFVTPLYANRDLVFDGINYYLSDDLKAAFVQAAETPYRGEIILPDTVIAGETKYAVTRINQSAFAECEALTAITIPATVTVVQENAFYNCIGLEKLTIADGSQKLTFPMRGESAHKVFFKAPLDTIYLGRPIDYQSRNSSYSDGYSPFLDKKTRYLTIGDEVTEIFRKDFRGSNSFEKITFGKGLSSQDLDFVSYDRLLEIAVDEANQTYSGFNGILMDKVQTKVIAAPRGYAGKITLPESMTVLNANAFSNCRLITSVIVPDNIHSIADYVFYNCFKLKEIILPAKLTKIGYRCFYQCRGLTSIEMPEGVTTIGDEAFGGCNNLSTIRIPAAVAEMEEFTFRSCTNLRTVIISDGPNSLHFKGSSQSCFTGCPVEQVYVGRNFTYYTYPYNVAGYDRSPFRGMTSLYEIELGPQVNWLGDEAFYGCSAIGRVITGSDVSLADIPGIKTIQDIRIGENAVGLNLKGCEAVVSVVIPDLIKKIPNGAFENCLSLESVRIGKNVMSIGEFAFKNTPALATVTIDRPLPPACDETSFDNFNKYLYVSQNALPAYMKAKYWKEFVYILGEPTPVTYHTVSLVHGEQGVIRQQVAAGDTLQLTIVPNEGWEINTVLFNDEDVTAELDSENRYTTPPVQQDAVINISFQSLLTRSEGLEGANLKAYVSHGCLIVEHPDPNGAITVYTDAGTSVWSGKATDGRIELPLPAKGFYLIKSAYRVIKVMY